MCYPTSLLFGRGEVLQYVHVYLCVTWTSQIPGNISNMNTSSQNLEVDTKTQRRKYTEIHRKYLVKKDTESSFQLNTT